MCSNHLHFRVFQRFSLGGLVGLTHSGRIYHAALVLPMVALFPVLGSRSFRIFCIDLSPGAKKGCKKKQHFSFRTPGQTAVGALAPLRMTVAGTKEHNGAKEAKGGKVPLPAGERKMHLEEQIEKEKEIGMAPNGMIPSTGSKKKRHQPST